MTKYLIAGHVIALERYSPEAAYALEGYRYDGPEPPEKVFAASPEDMERAEREWLDTYRCEIEEFLLSRQFCAWLAGLDGLYLHASAVSCQGRAYAFTADSGTGKSTHARLWKQAFGGEAEILNDDKPFIRRRNGAFYVCGSPWCGKERLTVNREIPLAGIGFLTQGANNEIAGMQPAQAVPLLLKQTFLPEGAEQMEKLLALVDNLVNTVPLYHLTCNISEDAARMAFAAMSPKANT